MCYSEKETFLPEELFLAPMISLREHEQVLITDSIPLKMTDTGLSTVVTTSVWKHPMIFLEACKSMCWSADGGISLLGLIFLLRKLLLARFTEFAWDTKCACFTGDRPLWLEMIFSQSWIPARFAPIPVQKPRLLSKSITTQGPFAPEGTLVNDWRWFCLSPLKRCYWHLVETNHGFVSCKVQSLPLAKGYLVPGYLSCVNVKVEGRSLGRGLIQLLQQSWVCFSMARAGS